MRSVVLRAGMPTHCGSQSLTRTWQHPPATRMPRATWPHRQFVSSKVRWPFAAHEDPRSHSFQRHVPSRACSAYSSSGERRNDRFTDRARLRRERFHWPLGRSRTPAAGRRGRCRSATRSSRARLASWLSDHGAGQSFDHVVVDFDDESLGLGNPVGPSLGRVAEVYNVASAYRFGMTAERAGACLLIRVTRR